MLSRLAVATQRSLVQPAAAVRPAALRPALVHQQLRPGSHGPAVLKVGAIVCAEEGCFTSVAAAGGVLALVLGLDEHGQQEGWERSDEQRQASSSQVQPSKGACPHMHAFGG